MYGYPPSTSVITPHVGVPMSEWSSGLCYGFFCSGCSTMESRAALEMRPTTKCDICLGCILSVVSFYWLGWALHGFFVMKNQDMISSKFNIKDDNTCLKSFCCLWCSVCQVDREISQRSRLGQLSVAKPSSIVMA